MMMALWDFVVGPFAEFAFMRRALVATLALAMSAAPLGVFLTLRRMSLLGDAISHAVLPGVAIGFMFSGLSLTAMATGGVISGMLAAGLAGFISRFTALKEDASLAAIYLVALALGVTLLSSQGTQLDSVSLMTLATLYRGLVLESFDPVFLAAAAARGWGRRGWVWQQAFLMLVVVNLVAGFQTLGTLMAVGLMMLPAVSARLWHDSLGAQLVNASAQATLAGSVGLLLSYHFDTPSGPTIIGCAGLLYGLSLLASPGGWLPQVLKRPHRVG
ncbi:MAG: hypothetical protein RLZZ371_1104 [Pseudomonadota bacterium]